MIYLISHMRTGECKLCLKIRILQDSHYMPRAMYKVLRDSKRKNPNPIFITNAKTATTSRQITDYVLCAECEQRFGKRESYVVSLIGKGNRFPLRDRMDLIEPLKKHSESTEYSGHTLGVDTEKLGYFALSMIWRGAVHEWFDPFGNKAQILSLARMEEEIRQHLLDQSPFPNNAVVIVRVCDDRTSRESMLLPSRTDVSGSAFEMFTPGIHFFVSLGVNINPVLRLMSCAGSKHGSLFRRNCQQRLANHYAQIEATSQRSAAVKAEWP